MRPGRRRFATGLALALAAIPIGAWRLERSTDGAVSLEPGRRLSLTGTVATGPRRFGSGTMFTLDTAAGRIAVRSNSNGPSPPVGALVHVRGTAEPEADWIAGYLRLLGARSILRAGQITSLGQRRGGVAGLLDGVRNRAAGAIDEAMPAREAALMRGFVLGDDSAIDEQTAEDFKRSGLAHLLAVSGQNVILLLIFASAILIALGVRLERRRPALALAVALYVPIAGGGPSIQRAGIMGIAGILAASMERPVDRWWALYLAAIATLAWNPLVVTDPGWQLSFAAVAGIALLARPLAGALSGGSRSGARAAFAEGAAITIAATLATAPLLAHHFGVVSIAALPANLLALPAVAPAMWGGMAIALAGQLPGLPLEPLGAVSSALAGYIEAVAAALAAPGWAVAELPLGSWPSVIGAYGLLAAVAIWARGLAVRLALSALRLGAVAASIAAAAALALVAVAIGGGDAPERPWRFETRFLDVGQGDAILLRERGGAAVMVDTGYAGTGAERRLRELGVERLEMLVLTHADADHAGNLESIAAALPIGSVVTNGLDRRLDRRIRALGLEALTVAAGDRFRFGGLRLDVVWPPRGVAPAGEPNDAGIVAVAGWRGYSELLTADAEAETAPYLALDVDVLKIPHHGSADAGLGGLLAGSNPELAVASLGADNPYGHPAPSTVAELSRAGVPLMRTDTDGEVRITVTRDAWAAG